MKRENCLEIDTGEAVQDEQDQRSATCLLRQHVCIELN